MLKWVKANFTPDYGSHKNNILNGAKLGVLLGIVFAVIIIAFS